MCILCEQNTFTRHICSHLHALISMSHVTLAQGSSLVVRALHLMCHLHVVCCLILYDSPFCFPLSLSSSFSFSCSSSSSSMWVGSMRSPMRTSANEELGTVAENNPLTGYEPNFIDNYHISEITEIFISHSRPSNLHDLELDDYTIGRALFTTVSGARRCSGPWTSLSLS